MGKRGKRRQVFTNERAFTLIELMATLVILAIIVAIAVPAVGMLTAKAKTDSDVLSAHMIEDAALFADMSGHPLENGGYRVIDLVRAGYLKLDEGHEFTSEEQQVVKKTNGLFEFKRGTTEQPPEEPGEDIDPPTEPEPEVTPPPVVELVPNAPTDFTVTKTTAGVTITGYVGVRKDIVIPPMIDGVPVQIISAGAFESKGVESVSLPDSIVTIGSNAFRDNQIATLDLGPNIETINPSAFRKNKLTELTIPESVVTITNYAFADNQIKKVTLNGRLSKSGGYGAFIGNPLETVVVGPKVERLDEFIFHGNPTLKSVTVHAMTTVIHANAIVSTASPVPATPADRIQLHATPGSTAQAYAAKYPSRIVFMPLSQ